jgi:hypothetical protein
MLRLLSSAAILFAGAHAFYLPGVAPTTYRTGDAVPVYVNTITPSLSQNEQQLKSVISYDCSPPKNEPPLCVGANAGETTTKDSTFVNPPEDPKNNPNHSAQFSLATAFSLLP